MLIVGAPVTVGPFNCDSGYCPPAKAEPPRPTSHNCHYCGRFARYDAYYGYWYCDYCDRRVTLTSLGARR